MTSALATTSSSGAAALALIRSRPFDFVLLDVRTPCLSGPDVLRHVRLAVAPRIVPIVLVTGHDRSEETVNAMAAGSDDVVSKPFDLPVVLARIQTSLRRTQAEHRRWPACSSLATTTTRPS